MVNGHVRLEWHSTCSVRHQAPTKGRRCIFFLLNAFNQDQYGNPIASMTNPGFGTNTNDWGARTITLSAKFSF